MASIIPVSMQATVAPALKYRSSYIYPVCIVVALGGVLFGFDLVIISGTIPFFTKYFQLDEFNTGWAVGCINIGAAAGAIIAGKLSDMIGRKKLLLICSFLFALTGILTGWAMDFSIFIIARLLSGVAVGVAALVCPMYIAEIAPASLRGRLVTLYQLAIVSGLLLAYLSNYILLNSGVNNWRWMFSSQTVPALLFFGGLFFVPESPRWLIKKKRTDDAEVILDKVGGKAYAIAEAENINKSFSTEIKENISDLFKKDIRPIVLIGVLVAFFSQADGQNSLFSYAPEIFKQAGLAEDAAFLQSVIIGIINFLFTFIAIVFIDKTGRKKLLLYGSLLLCIDAIALAWCFYTQAPGSYTLVFVFCFIAVYAATLGPVTWVILSEIFPNRIRGSSMSLATLVLWIANFITTASFPILKSYVGLHITFLIHAGICLLYFVFIWFRIPETKNKSLEEIEFELTRR